MDKIVSDEQRRIIEIVDFAIFGSSISLFGIAANAVNIIVFYQQGFKNTVNIGFFALAISDLFCLLSLEWIAVCMNPLTSLSGLPWVRSEVMYLTGAWLHVCFGRITSYITVYITAERYLCIAIPLKVKQIITPTTTAVALFCIYFVNLLTLVPEYTTSFLDWKFIEKVNRTLIAMIFTSSRRRVEGLVSVLHAVTGVTSFLGVIVFTSVLVYKLRNAAKWRKRATSGQQKDLSISTRDQKTVKMVVLISSILIACYTPGAIIAMSTFIVGPEFDIKGRYVNLCMSTWSLACLCHAINSSINIFFYYNMSSKYRDALKEILVNCFRCKDSGHCGHQFVNALTVEEAEMRMATK